MCGGAGAVTHQAASAHRLLANAISPSGEGQHSSWVSRNTCKGCPEPQSQGLVLIPDGFHVSTGFEEADKIKF